MLSADCTREFHAGEMAVLERAAEGIDFGHRMLTRTKRLHALAYTDQVTGLPNRHALELAVGNAPGARGLLGALQVSRFRTIAIGRGRAFKEAMLAALARRLEQEVGPDTMVAYAGGGQFHVWKAGPVEHGEPRDLIRQALARCTVQPLPVLGEELHFDLHCGLALAPEHGGGFEDLDRSASAALAEAESRQVDLFLYDAELRARAERALQMERDLRTAIASEQLLLHLQPKFDCRSGRLVGAEALLRWLHPTLGLVSPGEFIPLLESTGLIVQAGHWLVDSATRILAHWHELGFDDLRLAINVSARELREPGYLGHLQGQIRQAGVTGLDIEVTESMLVTDVEGMIGLFEAIRGLGCEIAIDDFGTGFSSLGYLSRLPADVLKIDQSFVAQVADNPDALSLVANIVGLAHTLGMKVVAEGVETDEQRRLLALLRCDVLQGYLLGKPVPLDAFEDAHLTATPVPGNGSSVRSGQPCPVE